MNKEELIRMAKEAGWQYAHGDSGYEPLWEFAKLVAQHERNEIIQILEDSTGYVQMDLIRERGQA
jgi:hypothetical protein